jgi:hypothetical protein
LGSKENNMSRTRFVFLLIVGAAVILVVIGLVVNSALNQPAGPAPTPTPAGPINVRVVAALGVQDWVAQAGEDFSASGQTLDGRSITVDVIPMDGLVALNRFDAQTMDPLPTAWIPDSRWLVELANASYKAVGGRDVFLTDGEYRARPVALSLFAWGIYQSRAEVLLDEYGEISWPTLHNAALAAGGWPDLGGEADWGYFKLLLPSPRRNIAGLGALISAAGEYYERPNIAVGDVTDKEFQQWLTELLGAVQDFSSSWGYPGESLALFGPSGGEIGQLLESDIIQHMGGAELRWGEPLRVFYPRFVTWFDYPFTVWIGPETTAAEKNAALVFMRYLLSDEMQTQAVNYGLRPAGAVSVDAPDSPFLEWQDQGVVTVIQRATAMRSPDRDVLQTLLRWFELNIAE